MDGVKVLASGFEADEKGKIEMLVTAMGGVFHSKASSDVSFVIVKNVLAAKYKWALHILKKPIVTVGWLYQCWNEHRIVPQESFRVLPFSGLTICVTRIPAAPEGDKYKVARRWGHIHIVTRKWFDQSIARRACLNEESYPVHSTSVSSSKGVRGCVKMQLSQGKDIGNLQSAPSSVATDTNSVVVPSAGFEDLDMEATLSQNTSHTFPAAPDHVKEGENVETVLQPQCEINLTNLDGCVADDSQSEDNDLYLSECRILFIGFEASEMRRLVNMVRRGGGSRYVLFNDRLTHIVVGTPSEIEKKEVRSLAAFGIIHVVRTTWLEDCDREKKEIPAYQRHVAQDLLLPKGALTGMTGVNQGRISTAHLSIPSNQSSGPTSAETGMPLSSEKDREEKTEINMKGVNSEINMKGVNSIAMTSKSFQQSHLPVINDKSKRKLNDESQAPKNLQRDTSVQNGKSSNVFMGKIFGFSSSFPEVRKGEIVQWIKQGGGEVVDAFLRQCAHFTVECHGVKPKLVSTPQATYVSSHWIRSCLEDGCLLEVSSHILFSPLPCQIPFPGFENFRFCVSQYEGKDRLLLKNLCFVLGAKLVEKLTKKVTHLLCKFAIGAKYDAACKWGIHSITTEWIYECVKQNKLVPLDLFSPKEVTAQDQEAGLCTMSQFPSQAVRTISGDNPSQFPSHSRNIKTSPSRVGGRNGSVGEGEGAKHLSTLSKKARLLEDEAQTCLLSTGVHGSAPVCNTNSRDDNMAKDTNEMSHVVPDVAAAIEDLLEQTSKIHDQKSPGRTGCDETLFSSTCSTVGQDHSDTHSIVGLSKHWLNR
ncbi:DNA topoisomerase 2-binding protein 1-A [Morus notabilis]|uniref:DNA topoisomerase 2-binding protein 1-A n=1 Tax=Morus notabilis TaxID=981085 RepID=W9R9M9_9ROSA|nr:DNA topoisomerase 2-binding protein 1-A [Morus notabilis]